MKVSFENTGNEGNSWLLSLGLGEWTRDTS